MQRIWEIAEKTQGLVAAKIRQMLGEAPLDGERLFTPEQRERRIKAMQLCARESTNDQERHLSWVKMHIDDGWVYGPDFDPLRKQHPNLVPWGELPEPVKIKAQIFDIFSRMADDLSSYMANCAVAEAVEKICVAAPGQTIVLKLAAGMDCDPESMQQYRQQVADSEYLLGCQILLVHPDCEVPVPLDANKYTFREDIGGYAVTYGCQTKAEMDEFLQRYYPEPICGTITVEEAAASIDANPLTIKDVT